MFLARIFAYPVKQLHKLLIKAFSGPFLLTFILSVFLLVMQFLWKYVDDLMGKGLEWYVLAELLLYASASLVIMALPLAVLLSSIMIMGKLGETYEIVAMKSAGLSLVRITYPLIMSILTLTLAAFLFANHVWPVANLKFRSLLWDVTRKKPTINLKENIFYNGIQGYSIRVSEKEEETDELHDILIYDHSKQYRGNKKVIRAEHGTMEKTGDGRYLVFTLFNGKSYEEVPAERENKKKQRRNDSHPHMRSEFREQVLRFDLRDFKLERSDEDLFSNDYEMLGLGQLSEMVDSLDQVVTKNQEDYRRNLDEELYVYTPDSSRVGQQEPDTNAYALFASIEKEHRKNTFRSAINQARSSKNMIEQKEHYIQNRKQMIARYNIEWHRKFTFPVACFILFMIGAPVGAISKKGGLGMPVVFSIILFLLYHISSMIGEKMVEEMVLNAWPGMWISTFILFPVGVILAWMANQDSRIMEADTYLAPFRKLARNFRK